MPVSKGRKHNYEAMYLVSQADAYNLTECADHVRELITKPGGEIISFGKWDERRLAYEIDKHKRGVYFLAYFSCDPVSVPQIERASNISETILRFMITRADHLTMEQMQAADGTQALADEAKLRGEEMAKAAEAEAKAEAEVSSEA